MMLPKNTDINKYIIKLIKDIKPLYNYIYSFDSIDIKTLKAYIKSI